MYKFWNYRGTVKKNEREWPIANDFPRRFTFDMEIIYRGKSPEIQLRVSRLLKRVLSLVYTERTNINEHGHELSDLLSVGTRNVQDDRRNVYWMKRQFW